jgi:hypothetical protein
MTELPDHDALQVFVQELRRLMPSEERPTGPLATIEQALVRLGGATIPVVLGPGIGTAEMIGIDLAQSLAPATGAMITTHVDAVHDATLARETLRDTGAARFGSP